MTSGVCKHCGSILASDGSCARCEFALALERPVPAPGLAPGSQDSPRQFGDYELLDELGHGGMGVVYRARQTKLNRIVALKLLLLGPFSSQESIQRFRREAQAAAALHHPNIVAIYDVGEVEGQHYFAMEYIEGPNLASRLREGPLPPRLAAEFCRAIADAISAAHAAGIVHRDLKPSNILVDPFDQLRITDFGLAKWFSEPAAGSEQSAHSSKAAAHGSGQGIGNNGQPKSAWLDLTVTGQILGSPNYLAPEIAAGTLSLAGPSSDVYSVGAILYECLAGRPPVMAATLQETLFRIRDAEPLPVRSLNPSVPTDLETICLKCLEKEPSRRYASAQELTLELDRFLKGEPVQARPISIAAKGWRWCQRKPMVAGLLGALVMAVFFGLSGVLWQWRRAQAGELQTRRSKYASDMNLVQQAWEEGNLRRAQELLRAHVPARGAPDLRGFEWRYLSNLCQDESKALFTNFEAEVDTIAFAPNGRFLAATVGPAVKLLDVNNRAVLGELREAESNESLRCLAFSPADTNLFATGGEVGTIRLWDLANKRATRFADHLPQTVSLVFSRDGVRLAAVSGAMVSVWVVEPKRLLWSRELEIPPRSVAFSPDGSALISGGGGGNGNARVWDSETGREDLKPFPTLHKGWMEQVLFSPDGTLMATCADDDKLILWDFAGRRPLSPRLRHGGGGMAFCGDGKVMASIGYDAMVHLWRLEDLTQEFALRRSLDPVAQLTFTPDHQSIVTAGYRSIRIWNAWRLSETNLLQKHEAWVHQLAFSGDGKRLVSVDALDFAVVWDVPSHRVIGILPGDRRVGGGVVFSPDGRLLATSSYSGKIMLWDSATLQPRGVLTNDVGISSLAFSPDGKVLAAATGYVTGEPNARSLFFWDMNTRRRINRFADAAFDATAVTFSHDGCLISIGNFDGSVRIWEWKTGVKTKEAHAQRGLITALAFSPDNKLLVSASNDDERLAVYRVGSPQDPEFLAGHAAGVKSTAVSPDGRTLAAGGNDGNLRLWSMVTFQPVLVLKQHSGAVNGVAFTRTGDMMASCDAEGNVRLWPAPP